MSGARNDLPALTGIRGIAAWLVVLFHVRLAMLATLPPEAIQVLGKGYLAVDLFFMLSGFVLYLNYADRLRAGGMATVPAFLGRRIARIWPLHAVILAGAIAFALVRIATGRGDSVHYPFSELPLHILLIQNWGFTTHLTWNDPAWSISCELAAYLAFPWLAMRVDWRRIAPVVAIGSLAALAGLVAAVYAWAGSETLNHDIPRLGLIRALCEFTMGTILCGLWLRWHDRPVTLGLAAGLAGTIALTATGTGLISEPAGVPATLAALLLIIALLPEAGNPLAARPIVYLGEISYSTYLVHFLLFVLFKILFVDDGRAVSFTLIGLFLAMVLAASVLLHHFVERPAQRALNRRFDAVPGRRARATVAPEAS
jgi:peptidoglycan/LPS O-acetylase OafA/YrhL